MAGKYKLGARAQKYRLGARDGGQARSWGPRNANTHCKLIQLCNYYMEILITLSNLRKITSFQIYSICSTIILKFLFHFRGRRRLFPFNGVLFTQEIIQLFNPNEMIQLCMENTKKMKTEEVSDFTVKLRAFKFFCTSH